MSRARPGDDGVAVEQHGLAACSTISVSFWRLEEDPEAKRELLQLIFERVWLDDGHVPPLVIPLVA